MVELSPAKTWSQQGLEQPFLLTDLPAGAPPPSSGHRCEPMGDEVGASGVTAPTCLPFVRIL